MNIVKDNKIIRHTVFCLTGVMIGADSSGIKKQLVIKDCVKNSKVLTSSIACIGIQRVFFLKKRHL